MKYIISFLAIVVLALIALSCKKSQTIIYPSIENINSVEDAFLPYIENENTAGLSIGTFDKGTITYYHLGETLKESGTLPDSNIIYEIGSISKTFTAALLADLSEEKLVSLEDHMCTYLPEGTCPWKNHTSTITLEDLSKHQSGFPRLPNNFMPSYLKDINNPYAAYNIDSLYRGVKTLDKKMLKKRDHEYSNYAVGLLGVLLANSQNATYSELVEERVFKKLGMSSSFIDVPEAEQNRFIKGYTNKGKLTAHWDLPALAGAGAIKSSITDMMKYLQAYMDSETPFINTLSNPTQISEIESIGLGWYLNKKGEDTLVWHNVALADLAA